LISLSRSSQTSSAPEVLLVVPHYQPRIRNIAQTTVGPPLGLAYLAAAVQRKGYSVHILDANALSLSDADTVRRILEHRPDLLGFSAVTCTVNQCGRLAGEVKAARPGTLICLGGPHPTALPALTLQEQKAVDFVVMGEGEEVFPEVLDHLAGCLPLPELPGLACRAADDSVRVGPRRPLIRDLDEIPFPSRDLLPLDRYRSPDGYSFSSLVAMRGCPGRCVYCATRLLFGPHTRHRAPRAVADEMEVCERRYGIRTLSFLDDTFTSEPEWVRALCAAVHRRTTERRLRWLCLTRVDRVDRDLLVEMKRAGCFKVEFGIESGSSDVLRFYRKGIGPDQTVAAFRAARDAGLQTLAFVMIHSPVESRESLEETRSVIALCDPDLLQVSFCTPYPGTELADLCEKEGLLLSRDWDDYIFLKTPLIRSDRFSPGEMVRNQKALLRSFYLRPRAIWRIARMAWSDLGSMRALGRAIAGGLGNLFQR